MSHLDGLTVVAAIFALAVLFIGMKKALSSKPKAAPESNQRLTLAEAIRQKVREQGAEDTTQSGAPEPPAPLAEQIRKKIAESNRTE